MLHPDDLGEWYDTVAHEVCHLIIWVYHRDERVHGPAFKKWMKKCGSLWGHLGVGEWEEFDVDDDDDDTLLQVEPICRSPHCQNLARQDDEILYEEQRCIDCQREHERKLKSKQRK